MFLSVLHFFNVLIFLDLTFAILACILLIKVPIKYGIKFISIPIVLLITYILVVQGDDMLGRAYELTPSGQFEFLDYRIIEDNGTKKIELWIVQNRKSRLHLIPYNINYEKKLVKAKMQRKAGMREKGEFTGNNGKGDLKEGDLSIADIPIEDLMPPKENNQ